jgi:hypothetical protein
MKKRHRELCSAGGNHDTLPWRPGLPGHTNSTR